MINRLVRLFIQDCDNVTDPAVREKYGVLSGAVGIVLNLLLSAGKFFAGVVTGYRHHGGCLQQPVRRGLVGGDSGGL